MRSFLSIQLLKRLSYPFHLTYNLSPFLLSTFSILNSFSFVFCNSFSLPVIVSPLKTLIKYVHGTVFLVLLTTKTSSEQFCVYSLAKIFFYFDILTRSPTLNLGSLFIRIFIVFRIRIKCNINWFYFYCSVNCVIVFINNTV